MATLNEELAALRKSNIQIEQMMEQARINRQMSLLKQTRKKDESLQNSEIEEEDEEVSVLSLERLENGSLKIEVKDNGEVIGG